MSTYAELLKKKKEQNRLPDKKELASLEPGLYDIDSYSLKYYQDQKLSDKKMIFVDIEIDNNLYSDLWLFSGPTKSGSITDLSKSCKNFISYNLSDESAEDQIEKFIELVENLEISEDYESFVEDFKLTFDTFAVSITKGKGRNYSSFVFGQPRPYEDSEDSTESKVDDTIYEEATPELDDKIFGEGGDDIYDI